MPPKRFNDRSDQSYQDYQDNLQYQGHQPHERRPFTRKDKFKVLMKARAFSDQDCQIINTFISSGEDLEYTLSVYTTSRASVYRLVAELDEFLEPK